MPAVIMQKIPPPIVPSHVFLGETRKKNGVLPIFEPTKYAKLSFAQVRKRMPATIFEEKLSRPKDVNNVNNEKGNAR